MQYGLIILSFFIYLNYGFVNASLTHAATLQEGKQLEEQPGSNFSEETPYTIDNNPFFLLLKGVALIIVMGLLLYLMLRVYKALTFGNGLNRGAPQIRVLTSSAIGPKKSLCLVDALDHILLLGVTDGQISVLLEIPANELNEQMKNSLSQHTHKPEQNFKKLLSTILKK